jgi:hypothetical protein
MRLGMSLLKIVDDGERLDEREASASCHTGTSQAGLRVR